MILSLTYINCLTSPEIRNAKVLSKNKLNNHYKNLEWVTYKKNAEHSFAKKVIMIDKLTNKDIKTFNSMAEAAESLGKNSRRSCNISACCAGRSKTAFGYKWRLE